MIYRFFLLFLILFLAIVTSVGAWMYTHSYEEIARQLFQYIQQWIGEARFREELFPLTVFERSKITIIVLIILLSAATAYSVVYRRSVQNSLSFVSASLVKGIAQCLSLFRDRLFLIFMLCLGSVKLFLISIAPFHVDEYASFILYVSKGPLIILSNYDVPNNHVLYNLIAWIFQFACTPFWAMKLPAVVASLLTVIAVFWYMKKHVPLTQAWLTLLILNMLSAFVVYGLFGRGHIFAILFFVGLMISYVQFFADRRYLMFIAVFTTLGIASVPYFILPAIVAGCTALFYMVWKKRMERIPYLCIAAFLSGLLVFVFYSPAIAFKGIDALYRHSWAQAVPFKEYVYGFPFFVQDVADTIISIEPVSLYVLILIQAIFFLMSGKESWSFIRPLLLFAMFATGILALLYHTPLFPRIWLFTLPVLAFQLGYLFYRLYLFSRPLFYAGFLVFSSYSMYLVSHTVHELNGYYEPMYEMVGSALHEKEDTVFIADDVYYMYAKYLLQEEHLSRHIVYSSEEGTLRIVPAGLPVKETQTLLMRNSSMMLVRRRE